jgi:predicted transcriptional regulator
MPKKYKITCDIDELFEGKAWLVHELAEKVKVPDYVMRSYLRTLWSIGYLMRVKNGRYYYYFTFRDYERYKKEDREKRLK